MTRLTKKDKYEHFYTDQANCRNIWSSDGKKLEGEYFENKTLAIDGKAIDKLSELEDIEDELGVDLVTLYKALTSGVWVKNEEGQIYHANVYLHNLILSPNSAKNNFCFVTPNDVLLLFYRIGQDWALTKQELEEE